MLIVLVDTYSKMFSLNHIHLTLGKIDKRHLKKSIPTSSDLSGLKCINNYLTLN